MTIPLTDPYSPVCWDHLETAIELASEGSRDDALFVLGEGMHPFMDNYSPEHAGFQVWSGFTGIGSILRSAGHLTKEYFRFVHYVDNLSGSTDELVGYYNLFDLFSP
jgi:hypothetical protein